MKWERREEWECKFKWSTMDQLMRKMRDKEHETMVAVFAAEEAFEV